MNPPSAPSQVDADSALALVESNRAWYRKHATYARVSHYSVEVGILVVAACIPATAALSSSRVPSTVLGVGVVILTGLRQIFDWHGTWLRCIDAERQLDAERVLYLHKAGEYAGDDRDFVLLQKVQSVTSSERRRWMRAQQTAKRDATDTELQAGR